jgi:trk system potassium uptake protein TrkH
VALLSYLGIGSKSLFRNESSFATGEATTARIRDTALLLWKVYLLITIACLLGLRAMGLSWFDAVTHTFAAVSTGGFSNYNNSIGFYGDWGNAALIEGWLIIFMTACSLNFLIYVLVARRKWKRLRDEEDGRWFVVMCLASAVAIAAGVAATSDQSFLRALRDGLFTVVTIASTTGFCTADYDRWPTYARIILALLMIVGGCAGSTAGGLKIGRLLVFFKASLHEIVKVFRPHQVFRLHVNGNPLGLDARAQVMMFIALYGAIICISTLLVTVLELGRPISMETAFGSVVATLSNIGPGFDAVGPTANFAGLRAVTQAFLGLLMVIGRLELYAILVLFIPAVWRKY